MKAILKSQDGESKGHKELPIQFNEIVRPDLIKRAVLALQSHKRQPYGSDPDAGMKYSSKISRRRRAYKGAYGIGISRVPRKIMSHSGTRFNWVAAAAPNTVSGRRVHLPKAEKQFIQKINKKERRKALRSAMSASVVKELVLRRGHIVEEYPIVLDNSAESIKKTKDALALLNKLGLQKELERSAKRTEKAGVARMRGRTNKARKGPLIVVSGRCSLMDAASNIPGIDVADVASLNVEMLAPGADYGRIALYTEGAIDALEKKGLFMEGNAIIEAKKPKAKKPAAKKASAKKVDKE